MLPWNPQGSIRGKIPQLRSALEGHVTDHHRFILNELMDHLEYLEGQIERFSQRIEEVTGPFEEAIKEVARLPGFEKRSAENVIVLDMISLVSNEAEGPPFCRLAWLFHAYAASRGNGQPLHIQYT